jgi:hypothetical protein
MNVTLLDKARPMKNLLLNDWDDSIKRVTAEASKKNMPLIHPMIGEEVDINGPMKFSRWWENII